ncbi:unnamed protein product [Calypogeia fissa]
MTMASTCCSTAAAGPRNWWGVNSGVITTHCTPTTHQPPHAAGFPVCGVSHIPIRFASPVVGCCIQGTGCRHGHPSRRRAPIWSVSRRNSSEVGKSSARGRKESGEPRLKEATAAKGFGRSPVPSSGATAEVQDRLEDPSLDGPVEGDPIVDDGQEEKPSKVVKPHLLHGLQKKTAAPDVGDDFEHREQEVARGLVAAQVFSPEETSSSPDEEESRDVSSEGSSSKERTQEEVATILKGESVDLAIQEASLKAEQLLQKEMTKKAREGAYRGEVLKLASKSTYIDNKIFFYPDPAIATSELEIFFNRPITALANRPSIFVKGGYNDWRWGSFFVELRKTSDLPGDWWVCKVEVPKEAYKVDFIFFDGEYTFENNAGNNFFISVEGGMTNADFEYFLLEERAKEAGRVADEKAKKEREAAEARRVAEHEAAKEADGAEAKRVVDEKREKARMALQKAVTRAHGLWYIEPAEFGEGDRVTLYYNRSSRPLAQSREIWIHSGANNWEDMVSIVGKLSPTKKSKTTELDWWAVAVIVPEKAYMLNWVFADGPPSNANVYDNNDYQDFHALVTKSAPEDVYWGEVEKEIYEGMRRETLAREAAAQRKIEHRQKMKDETKAKTMQTFLKSQAHIFYTDPSIVRAGEDVTIFYNPSNTVLNGKPEVYIRGSFNRWTFRHGIPTTKLTPASNGTHLMTTVKVPKDVYVIDFVFSEWGGDDGGVYDNRNGLDYHVPVVGSNVRQPPLDIVHIALEMAPIAKVGGLGDVVTSLSRAIEEQGHCAHVVLPKYDCMNYRFIQDLHEVSSYKFGGTKVRVWNGKVEGLTVHFLEPENGMFWVGCVYGRRDDAARFGFFCHAALEYLRQSGRHPDIIHCHDWSSAPVAWLFREYYKQDNLAGARIIFTIHNLEFGAAQIGRAMANTHMATTVSPTYAREVIGNPVISPHWYKFHGILNGIDPDIWDPYIDPFIPVKYTAENVVEGKKAAKKELQHRLGLRQDDRPLVGIISRLTAQKGIDLIKHGIWRTLDRGGQVVLLGSAPDPRIQNDFVGLANQLNRTHNDTARLWLSYDEPLSHLIYAGADFILIPSIFEPCGLTQLTAMRYGAIPIVRQTGGLYDTIFDVDHDQDRARDHGTETNGFSFAAPDGTGLDYAMNRAISAWYEAGPWFNELCKRVMQQDWSWNRPALDYIELYNGAKKLP